MIIEGFLHELEVLSFAALDEQALIKRYVSKLVRDSDGIYLPSSMLGIAVDLKMLFPLITDEKLDMLTESIITEHKRQHEIIARRKEAAANVPQFGGFIGDRLLRLAKKLLLPAEFYHPCSSYIDVKICDKKLVALNHTDGNNKKMLVYRIGDYLGMHDLPRHVRKVESAETWVKPIDVRAASKHRKLDGRKVRNVWNNWEQKLFYIDVEGTPLVKMKWRTV